jgi:hypothetical protein
MVWENLAPPLNAAGLYLLRVRRRVRPWKMQGALRATALERYGVAQLPAERTMPRQNVYQVSDPIIPGKSRRPSPPPQLDARERAIWTKITARLPTDWVATDNAPLKELCRHIRIADDLAGDLARARAAIDEIQKQPEPDSEELEEAKKEYYALLRAHGYQSERIGNLSTKLRLTPQSRYAPSTANRDAAKVLEGPEPWNDWGSGRADRKQ